MAFPPSPLPADHVDGDVIEADIANDVETAVNETVTELVAFEAATGTALAGKAATGHTHTHASTTGQTADDHHAKSHAHNGADGSGTVAHSATTGRTADDHHAQVHAIGGADHTGTLAHTALGSVGVDDHHARDHHARHESGGADVLTLAESQVTGLVSDLAGKAASVHGHAESDVTGLTADLALKAPLASPALTGTPTVPTAAQGTNTTQIASTAYVQTEAGLLVPKSLVDAKGDLFAGTADNTVARLPVGMDGQVLTAASGQSTGLQWATPSGGYTDEQARDAIGAALVAGSGMVITVSDPSDTITIQSEGMARLGNATRYARPGFMVTSGNFDVPWAATTIYYFPAFLQGPVQVDAFNFYDIVAGSAGNARVGYCKADADWQPIGASVVDCGTVGIASTGDKTGTFSASTMPGGRVLYILETDATFQTRGWRGQPLCGTWGDINVALAGLLKWMSVGCASGCPALTGTAWTTIATNSGAAPYVESPIQWRVSGGS